MKIVRAEEKHAEGVLEVTKQAFIQYKNELKANIEVKALSETLDMVKKEISSKFVFVAISHGEIIGCVRVEKINDEMCYISRFSVAPTLTGGGVGSSLIAHAIEECEELGATAIALHTNTRYFKLCRYYYGKDFFVYGTTLDRGYIRGLFIKELKPLPYDITPALTK